MIDNENELFAFTISGKIVSKKICKSKFDSRFTHQNIYFIVILKAKHVGHQIENYKILCGGKFVIN